MTPSSVPTETQRFVTKKETKGLVLFFSTTPLAATETTDSSEQQPSGTSEVTPTAMSEWERASSILGKFNNHMIIS